MSRLAGGARPAPELKRTRKAAIEPGSVWKLRGSPVGRTVVVQSAVPGSGVTYEVIAGNGPRRRTIARGSFLSSYARGAGARQLTSGERNEARHLLQALFEQSRAARNAIEPETGVLGLTAAQWVVQWESMKADLDAFARQVQGG